MTTQSPATHSVATLDTLPRPKIPAAAWARLFFAPESARRHFAALGERFVIDVPLMPTMFWTASPEDVRAVFSDKTRALSFGTALRRVAPHEILFGDRIMTWWASDDHTVLRRKVAPAFMGKALKGYEPAMAEVAGKMVRELPTGRPISFHPHMLKLAREVIMSVVFGVTEPQRRARLTAHLSELDHLIGSPGLALRYAAAMVSRGRWLPFPALDRVLADLDQVTYDEMSARRSASGDADRHDCLATFLRLQQADEDGLMDDEMVAGFQRLLLVAGNDTTAATLSWVVERLVRHPEVLHRVEQTLAAGDESYLDAVITETLRLRPTIPFTARTVNRDVVVNDVFLPRGSMIFLYINGIHRRADLYDAPDEFRPERFLGTTPDPAHWLPFGGGINRCLGGNMAMFEARVLLRTILQEVTLVPEDTPGEDQQAQTVLLLPRQRARVTLQARPERAATR
ncbi:cytochrome P450 [Mycobacterium sp. Y57]|uniref:cytochrome P450 n=1 Tax=Mycolicibacterium xanthum TaxID=2796469 RepID=UPI001C84C81B|nr:cytochrome P450 [Mycolicibacterium xanthum]MBX7433385.1 cytochrome P450 [Mycolicibacterium xanthum]